MFLSLCDDSKKISRDHFSTLLSRCDIRLTDELRRKIWRVADIQNSGYIAFEDFARIVGTLVAASLHAQFLKMESSNQVRWLLFAHD
jgi:Ca2+-binding EF-hand superfamily protein